MNVGFTLYWQNLFVSGPFGPFDIVDIDHLRETFMVWFSPSSDD